MPELSEMGCKDYQRLAKILANIDKDLAVDNMFYTL